MRTVASDHGPVRRSRAKPGQPSKQLLRLLDRHQKAKIAYEKRDEEGDAIRRAARARKPRVPDEIRIDFLGSFELAEDDLRKHYIIREYEKPEGEDAAWLSANYWLLVDEPEKAKVAAKYEAEYRAVNEAISETFEDEEQAICDQYCDAINTVYAFEPRNAEDVRLLVAFSKGDLLAGSDLPDDFTETLLDWIDRFLLPQQRLS